MSQLKILGFCGSLRNNSYNKKLLAIALKQMEQMGCATEFIDLKFYPLPLFDEDVMAQGTPEHVVTLGNKIREADALIVANPEYNGSVSGVMKNAVDWMSIGKNPFKGKVMGLVGCSTGWWGASKSLIHARAIFVHLGGVVVPTQLALPQSEINIVNGALKEESHKKMLDAVCKDVELFARKFKN
jgi:NAD(P)H-dependent FMN reductase